MFLLSFYMFYNNFLKLSNYFLQLLLVFKNWFDVLYRNESFKDYAI
jgi:hypothetical protein